jgi:hypothetical protein
MPTKPRTATPLRPARKAPIAPATLADDAVAEVLDIHESVLDGLTNVDPEFRHEMVATAAYYIAEQRGFAPGHEVDDWLAAEAAVDQTLGRIPAPAAKGRLDAA